jgi:hypothetical protein
LKGVWEGSAGVSGRFWGGLKEERSAGGKVGLGKGFRGKLGVDLKLIHRRCRG